MVYNGHLKVRVKTACSDAYHLGKGSLVRKVSLLTTAVNMFILNIMG